MTVSEKVEQKEERERGERPVRDELRRIASNAGFAMRLAAGRAQLTPPTPSDGPDPYGNPDPDWLRVDWREHLRQIDVVGVASRRTGHAAVPPSLPNPVYAYFRLSGSRVTRTYTIFRLLSDGGVARPQHPNSLNFLRLYGRQATILLEVPGR